MQSFWSQETSTARRIRLMEVDPADWTRSLGSLTSASQPKPRNSFVSLTRLLPFSYRWSASLVK